MGGAGAVERAGGLVLDGSGEWDLGVRLQGVRPFGPEPHELVERLALDPAADRLVYESRGAINPDAREWLRYDYRSDRSYIVDMLTRRVFPGDAARRVRLERTVPHRLLEEVLRAGGSLRDLGEGHGPEGRWRAVAWTAPGGTALTLSFDPGTGLLREAAYVTDMPVRGDASIVWRYGAYRPVDGLGVFPAGYSISVDGRVVRSITWREIATGSRTDLLTDVDSIDYPPPPTAGAVAAGEAGPMPGLESFDIRDLAPGVFLLPDVRGGFHMLFVEFEDFVLAVDAPAGWLELQELPAVIGFGPRGSTAVADRYLRAIRSRVPDKPVRYVVLTHHHDDHAGGVRPFIEAGATVLAAPVTRPVVEEAITGNHTLAGIPTDAAPPSLRFEPVGRVRTIADHSMEVRLIDVGPNPHADGMLVVHLPRHDLLYVADLFEPTGTATFPSPARLPVMRWFVRWLDDSGLDPDRIYTVHGRALVTPDQLDLIRSLPPDTTSSSLD